MIAKKQQKPMGPKITAQLSNLFDNVTSTKTICIDILKARFDGMAADRSVLLSNTNAEIRLE